MPRDDTDAHKQTTNTKKTQERRWKAWWAGQGHPTCVNNTNLERYIPDCPVDVSYDAEGLAGAPRPGQPAAPRGRG